MRPPNGEDVPLPPRGVPQLLGLSAIPIAFMLAIGVLSIANLESVDSMATTKYQDRVMPLEELGPVGVQFMNLCRLAAHGVATIEDPSAQAGIDKRIADAKAVIDEHVKEYASRLFLEAEKAKLADFLAQYADYLEGLDAVRVATLAHDGATALTTVQSLAATEEMSARAEGVVASATTLAEMASSSMPSWPGSGSTGRREAAPRSPGGPPPPRSDPVGRVA